MLTPACDDAICQYKTAGSRPYDKIAKQSRSMVPLTGSGADTAWPRESIINSYVDAGHASRACTAARYEAVRHMRLQYDNTGRSMSLHVELALH